MKTLKLFNERLTKYEEVLFNVNGKELMKDITDGMKDYIEHPISYYIYKCKDDKRELRFIFYDEDQNQLLIRIYNYSGVYYIYLSRGIEINVPMLDDIQNPEEYIKSIMSLPISYDGSHFMLKDIDFDFAKITTS